MKIIDLPKTKHSRYFEAAHLAAAFFCGAGRNNFRLGSCLIHKKQIVSVKANSAKTHPKLVKFTKYPFLHSESNAILSYGLDNCEGCSLYVVRILRNEELAMAKPCDTCQELIKHVGIKKVFYTTENGYEEFHY